MDGITRERRTPRRVLAILATLALTVGMLADMAATAAATMIIRDTITMPITETGITHDCREGITGTLVGTEVVSYQSVETSQGFHIEGTASASGQITWSDGTYTIIESTDHFSLTAGARITVNTNAHVDSGDFYSADGSFLFRDTFHLEEHFTITDGVVRVDFVRGRFHFFGDC